MPVRQYSEYRKCKFVVHHSPVYTHLRGEIKFIAVEQIVESMSDHGLVVLENKQTISMTQLTVFQTIYFSSLTFFLRVSKQKFDIAKKG